MELEIEEYLEDKFEKLRFRVVIINEILRKNSYKLEVEIKTRQNNILVYRIYYIYDKDFTFESNMSLLTDKIIKQLDKDVLYKQIKPFYNRKKKIDDLVYFQYYGKDTLRIISVTSHLVLGIMNKASLQLFEKVILL